MRKVVALVLALLVGFPFALECGGTIYGDMMVPAVSDTGYGQMVNISLEIKPGDGTAYVSTSPIVGGLTQASATTAMEVAMRDAGYDATTCDALFRIGKGELSSIDGPSAGAAMTLLVTAALENRTVLHGLTLTGSIDGSGGVGSVGGIPTKAQAAAKAGFNVLLVPYLSMEERIMLDALGDNVNIDVMQVRNINDVEGVAFSDNVSFEKPMLPNNTVPDVRAINDLDGRRFERFRKVAKDILERGRATAEGMSQEHSEYVDYFDGEFLISENAFENGYYYSGANTAFIAWINAELLESTGASRGEMEARIRSVGECYDRALGARATDANWEWVVGGQLRASWAKKRVSGIDNKSFENEIKRLETMKNIIYAESWCAASDKLIATSEGAEIDQNLFKDTAEESIKAAEDYLSGRKDMFPDPAWHLEAAKQEFGDGLYGAAVYDATYAQYMARGQDELSGSLDKNEFIARVNERDYKSVWAEIYGSQSKYLQETEGMSQSVFQLSMFSEGLENSTAKMLLDIERKGLSAEEGGAANFGKLVSLFVFLAMLAIVFIARKKES